MRFLAFALVVVATVSYCQDDDTESLIKMADDAGAPLTKIAMERLQQTGPKPWGAKRAERSTDVMIINSSGKSFKLKHKSCVLGAFSDELLPEDELLAHTSTVYGIESIDTAEAKGLQCVLVYGADDGITHFKIMLANPFLGDNADLVLASKNLIVSRDLGHGHNSWALYTVKDA